MSFKLLLSSSGSLRRIYFEAIDLMVNAIDQCFNQSIFDTYARMESLFIVKALRIRRITPQSFNLWEKFTVVVMLILKC